MTKTKQKPKPRLSMKLLWKFLMQHGNTSYSSEEREIVTDFLEFVEQQMKPLKP